MSDTGIDQAEPADEVRQRGRPRGAALVAIVAVVGLGLGGLLATVLTSDGDDPAPADVAATIDGRGELLGAFVAEGVPDVVAGCAAETVADQPAAVRTSIVARPLVEGGLGREAVAACALEHLASAVEEQAGLEGTDARCVAGELIDRLGLGPVLASIGALAVTPEVSQAAADAAAACIAPG